eukprot:GHVU01197608.1.p1 GENE.GHVU01197608.1~~GHVU01197608.1.p1  ORF type:complete len:125 (+),score=18.51 GHVU01197608.1:196-570(+)
MNRATLRRISFRSKEFLEAQLWDGLSSLQLRCLGTCPWRGRYDRYDSHLPMCKVRHPPDRGMVEAPTNTPPLEIKVTREMYREEWSMNNVVERSMPDFPRRGKEGEKEGRMGGGRERGRGNFPG